MTDPAPQIRPFRSEDLDELKQIMVDAFDGVSIDQGIHEQFGPIGGHDWKWRKARHLDEDVHRDPQGIFVLELDGRVMGSITTWIDREAGLGHIPNLSLRPEVRGQGWGRRLLLHAFDWFRQHGVSHAKIETLAQNEVGNHLYQAVGFRPVARQVHFVADLSQAPSE